MTGDPSLKPHDRAEEISGEWGHDNQQWWNQYMASADNDVGLASGPAVRRMSPARHLQMSGRYQSRLICRLSLTPLTNSTRLRLCNSIAMAM
jgi:hypothetical protein